VVVVTGCVRLEEPLAERILNGVIVLLFVLRIDVEMDFKLLKRLNGVDNSSRMLNVFQIQEVASNKEALMITVILLTLISKMLPFK